jgi:hypothetical protein
MELLSPFPHVLNHDATACHEECPACYWATHEKPEVEALERLYDLEDPRG